MLRNPSYRFILAMALFFAVNAVYLYLFPPPEQSPLAQIAYSRFKTELRQGLIVDVTIQGTELSGNFIEARDFSANELVAGRFEGSRSFSGFRTMLPPLDDPELLPLLDQQQVTVTAKPAVNQSLWTSLLISLLPWVVIIAVWMYFFRRFREQGLGGGFMGQFRKSGALLYAPKTSPVTFADVAGLAEAKQELQEVVAFLQAPDKFTRLGGKVPRGILLVGPPGTGKTLMARAVAGEAQVPFFSISASQFIEMFVGVGASRVRDLFTNAKKNAPSIIFVDELDAVGQDLAIDVKIRRLHGQRRLIGSAEANPRQALPERIVVRLLLTAPGDGTRFAAAVDFVHRGAEQGRGVQAVGAL